MHYLKNKTREQIFICSRVSRRSHRQSYCFSRSSSRCLFVLFTLHCKD